jgi:tRNA-2-methylthio-N6-dimethylallyladenosine synthase
VAYLLGFSYHPASDNILTSYEGKTPFSKLLRACAATGMPRIKFTTSFPRDFHSDIISAMEEYDNLCNWVHLPAQSGSNRILSAMRRGYTREEYLLKVERIRASFRQNSLTTDIIVGYPGESEDDFEQTLRLVEECQFDSCYIFKYSKRSGTPASLITNNTNEQIIRERFSKVETLQKSIQKKKLESMVGQVYEVLVEGVSARDRDLRFGHTTCHRIVNFSAEQTINTGQIVNVVIETSKEHSLLGHAIQA